MSILVKHPAEQRQYTLDFSGVLPASGPRGTVWSGAVLGTGEVFGSPLLLPLLMAMVPALPTPSVLVTRSDGAASDLTVGTVAIQGNQVSVFLAGGTDGLTYRVTVFLSTTLRNVVALQGQLQVSANLP